jgi:hypothetical protein
MAQFRLDPREIQEAHAAEREIHVAHRGERHPEDDPERRALGLHKGADRDAGGYFVGR